MTGPPVSVILGSNMPTSPSPSDFIVSPGVVNVASVPQRSPFRYPGGKTWLIPRFRAWMRSLRRRPRTFIEPFAGGGAIALTVAMENLAERVVMSEIDPSVAAVWKVIIHGDYPALVAKIMRFQISRETVIEALSEAPKGLVNRAFQTIVRNRVQRGGILAPGASLVKRGENGKGVGSRWYPLTLARRIAAIAEVRNRIVFRQADGMEIIAGHVDDPSAAYFVDPPYTAGGKRAGTRLYTFSRLDHAKLFELLAQARGPAMITYDDAAEPRVLARQHGFAVEKVRMSNAHHSTMTELVITKP